TVQATTAALITFSDVDALVLNAGGGPAGADAEVEQTAAPTPVTINAGGAGPLTVNVTMNDWYDSNDNTINIAGVVTVNGQGIDTLNLNDQQDFYEGPAYTITSATVQAYAAALVHYSGLANLVLNTTQQYTSDIAVESTAAGTQLTVNGPSANVV